jgi:hypothetical protein
VVVVYTTDSTNFDSVVFGYAFRDHWMWYNGYAMDDGHYVSFIIWKDYNCNGWASINRNAVNDMGLNAGINTFPTETRSLVYAHLLNFGFAD